jgi:hypothetical protein
LPIHKDGHIFHELVPSDKYRQDEETKFEQADRFTICSETSTKDESLIDKEIKPNIMPHCQPGLLIKYDDSCKMCNLICDSNIKTLLMCERLFF